MRCSHKRVALHLTFTLTCLALAYMGRYHPRKAVPKLNQPIIEFGGIEGFFLLVAFFTAFLGSGLSST